MAPMTKFGVDDPNQYLEGFGNYHSWVIAIVKLP